MSQSYAGPERTPIVASLKASFVVVCWMRPGARVDADWRAGIEQQFGEIVEAGAGTPLAELADAHPDKALLLLRAGLQPSPRLAGLIAGLADRLDDLRAVAFPGNFDPRTDAFAGLDIDPGQLDAWSGWLAERAGQGLEKPAPDCLLLAPGTRAGTVGAPGVASALLVDDGYVFDPACPAADPDPDDEFATPRTGALRLRAERLIELGETALPDLHPAHGTTLHIAHSWGGGVWRWIEDFAAGDAERNHLVLVADSDDDGLICGRGLTLYAAGPGRAPIRELALAPRVEITAREHAGYRARLEAVIERFSVERIVVSSLIGHSLDALATGLPTLVMLHDFFPLWPLFEDDPDRWLEAADGDAAAARAAALAASNVTARFAERRPEAWNRLAAAWLERVAAPGVVLAAPAQHVIDRVRRLAGQPKLVIARVPHGFRGFDGTLERATEPAAGPLHLVIPGRLNAGKGRELLAAALPKLAGRVRLTALGCGRDAIPLMGQAGIDLITDYDRDALPEFIATLQPHGALLASTVPETWSYTLSEMRALGLAPLATRVGSFAERIEDGVDGVLFAPEPEALVEAVERFVDRPEALAALAAAATPDSSVAAMAKRLNALLPASEQRADSPVPELLDAAGLDAWRRAGRLAEARRALRRERDRRAGAEAELDRRTRWAETMERQFRERSEWARQLDDEVSRLGGMLREHNERHEALAAEHRQLAERHAALGHEHTELADHHRQLREHHDQLKGEHQQLQGEHQHLQAQFDEVVGSRSWRLTRPLRFVSRVARNPGVRRSLNPLNWPRTASRIVHHLKLRGLRATLNLLQGLPDAESPPLPTAATVVPSERQVAEPVMFSPVDAPQVSVIVPVYNQLHFTAACLESLAAAAGDTPFEVIVVDDASADETPVWLKRCSGVKVLRNRRNLGFIGTCNRGAKAASGRWLVFLNNDTRVTDGWLDALVRTFERDPAAGVAGGRLVFGDGALQEAGGIVFDDGSAWNYGRGEHPDRPEFGFVAEVDYVSGACLAIGRELFADLGGFDRDYAPAYYEDTDLCMKVRARGLKVVYQPAATVIHFEGATSGTDEASGAKRYQAVNREKFARRWAEALAAHPVNPGEYSLLRALALRDRRLARRALVIDATTPMPDHDSGSVRLVALLKLLVEQGFRTSFLPENRLWAGRHSSDLQQLGIEVLHAPWVQDPEQWLSKHGEALDLIVVSRHYVLAPMLKMLRALCPNAKLVFDTVDLHFLREQREAELSGAAAAKKAAEKTRTQELRLINEADATWVVSPVERELLAEQVPQATVEVLSNIHALAGPGKPFEQRHGLLFVGGFQHPPNVDAAEWLIDEILPRVVEQLPEVTLHLIGSRMPESLKYRRAPGLKVHGFVAELEPFLAGCRISVAPLRYGAGVKGKVNQSMAHGLPVVATGCAAEGMFCAHERELLVADDAESFAGEIVRLYRDRALWQRLAEGGRANVEQHFSVAAARRALAEMLNGLGLERPTGRS